MFPPVPAGRHRYSDRAGQWSPHGDLSDERREERPSCSVRTRRDFMQKLKKHKAYLFGVVAALAIAGAQISVIVGTCGFKWGG